MTQARLGDSNSRICPLFVEFKLPLRYLKLSVNPEMVTPSDSEGGQGQPLVVEPRP